MDNRQRGQISIGEYAFSFPKEYVLEKGKGTDSYVGKIKGRNMSFGFDYGYYSNSLVSTKEEYLEKGFWKMDAYFQFTKPEEGYTPEMAREIQVIKMRPIQNKADSNLYKGADLVAICKLGTHNFEYGIAFPAEIKEHEFIVDTINGHYRKIVIAKDPGTGITGIYLKNLTDFNNSMNAFPALSMEATGLTKQQQDSVVKVFQNVDVTKTK